MLVLEKLRAVLALLRRFRSVGKETAAVEMLRSLQDTLRRNPTARLDLLALVHPFLDLN